MLFSLLKDKYSPLEQERIPDLDFVNQDYPDLSNCTAFKK